jgi:hypothetical protein
LSNGEKEMILTNGEAANEWLRKMTTEQLKEGLNRGIKKLAACPDPNEYATGGYRDWSDGHPNLEMRESVEGWQQYALGFAKIRVPLETDQELVRRGENYDISGVKMVYFADWKLPKEMIRT